MTTMPFGKWKDTPLDEVPPKYLRWVLKEVKTLSPDLKADITAVLKGRPLPKSTYEQIDDLFNAIYYGETEKR